MQELAKYSDSILWWVSITLIGIAFTFLVPIVKGKIDRLRGSKTGRSDEWLAEVEAIKGSSVRQSLQVARVAHHYGRSSFFFVVAILLFFAGGILAITGSSILCLISVVLVLLGVREFRYGQASYEQMKAAGES
ncbi:MAG: hypothetical protein GXP10_05040 [Gammaproteobacteria bacterium]|nr:hypothetical protein [Gammaproteobacteria bacterium]